MKKKHLIEPAMVDRLKAVRCHTGKSQRGIARELGISFMSWQTYEAGKSYPGGQVFEKLNKMGFCIDWLLTGEGEMLKPILVSTEDEFRSSLRKAKSATDVALAMKGVLNERLTDGQVSELQTLAFNYGLSFDSLSFLITKFSAFEVAGIRPKGNQRIDESMLISIIEMVDDVIESTSIKISSTRKARLIVSIYRMKPKMPLDKDILMGLVSLSALSPGEISQKDPAYEKIEKLVKSEFKPSR